MGYVKNYAWPYLILFFDKIPTNKVDFYLIHTPNIQNPQLYLFQYMKEFQNIHFCSM